ncbi:MAG: response regulator, partial [Verrucomicrobiae bacterium]|nr:response regulator [Verrucomicrobiae bacterium]
MTKPILIAEDDPVSCKVLEATLARWGYAVQVTRDGEQAWTALQAPEAPPIAVLDWMMPGIDGVEVCRRVRTLKRTPSPYLMLLTAKHR